MRSRRPRSVGPSRGRRFAGGLGVEVDAGGVAGPAAAGAAGAAAGGALAVVAGGGLVGGDPWGAVARRRRRCLVRSPSLTPQSCRMLRRAAGHRLTEPPDVPA